MEEIVKVSEMEARGSKTLVAAEPLKEPTWLGWTLTSSFRVIMLAVLWAGLGMGVGLFFGIFAVLALGAIQHQTPDMSLAYRHVAVPVAILSGSCAFLWNLFRMVQEGAKRGRAD
jgi:1,4-dihydroxy-2-naphthoate octaprenyltransferase